MASTSADGSSSPRPKAAARLLHSVKRTLSPTSGPRRRHTEYPKSGMRSTNEEFRPAASSQPFRDPDPAASRPTIEQIAMGLHRSRTPHLRPLSPSSYSFPQRNSTSHSGNPYDNPHRATPVVLPPPPSRSSMKKPSTSSSSSPVVTPPFSSTSSTTATSVSPSSSQSPRSFAAIKFRMSRLLPTRSSSAPSSMMSSTMSSPRTSTSDFPAPKKAVRFTTEEPEDGES
ncbi:hypothetical protein CVT26_003887 [Gymnopilus dilepis]|uniref:Uncharacterized protein n=1 Tax=Gymnopilus dilepis TaxID=231916 RepID=A0A409W6W5_9AGAR|nr:hypothetical protein CVT26_003887 [Gymnopilus dilepis]